MKRQVVFVGSTRGGILSRVGVHQFVRDVTLEVVSDRDCGFLGVAQQCGIESQLLAVPRGETFADTLLQRYGDERELLFVSFYTRLFRGEFLTAFKGRIFNCHPSILPSFAGMRGFEDTISSKAKFMGCTIHVVDEGIDTGEPIIQSAIPVDTALSADQNRHKVFLAQYYSTAQFLKWIHDDRLAISPDGKVAIADARYRCSAFSPNLDPDLFSVLGESNQLA